MPDRGRQLFDQLMRFRPEGLTANAWAVKAGISRNFWNDLKRHGNPSRRTLEKLLAAADTSLAEFEALRIEAPATSDIAGPIRLGESSPTWRPPPLVPLPVVATQAAGVWGEPGNQIELLRISRDEIIGQVPRPLTLASDPSAYAVTMIGDSMWPRFRPDRNLVVSPASPATIGDDVLVFVRSSLSAGEEALIGELVRRRPDGIRLRQFNPDLEFQVQDAHILAVHKVLGELF